MQVLRGFPAQAHDACVLTIGNFDGLHRGHQALLQLLTDKAREMRLPAAVMTFEPHPREYFSPADAPARLASLREKLLLLAAGGVDRVHVCRFDARFAALSADSFIQDGLIRGLNVRHLFVGDDFRFGARRSGDFEMLLNTGRANGFGVESMPTLIIEGERASSSAVRAALADGDLDHAACLLGRPYSIAGRVVHGDKLGRQLGFPTANVQLKHRRPALSGVFAVGVEGLDDQRLPGVANIGIRPTATDAAQARLEVHLLDRRVDCYGAHLRIHFLKKLRDEQKFASLDALKHQIAQDADAARVWLSLHQTRLLG
ncbi:bifunctional riboflavin kinase/FAD synthetase [Azoarcus communis]|uniref:Riboflavin biosynthesis protein n=1 Tax=Parazoarcus communis SWub3 = DSM 12120 TaxID=1121029 RepID=A0A323US29_9RHOO|nr:bifunctional riboflavin kinase/FAD synthetase [Parazoarcus communis]NMG50711.1 bifunctional riboflavin kinase/FAD synthetase [Parazoarcus communis]NMG70503.1 bifunctional riboflavin kinase/FAD synthetase [Parazoarcus communis SWub3 = DSM 12120]PZA15832.1 bifunctional riboflavin kinase/FAD synthetase [Azoarcus communis] [Parazoarcus communis SWub3 = DSM 12120]